MLNALLSNLYSQIIKNKYFLEVEILVNSDNKEKTSGRKAQELIERAKGNYIAFIDDDDEVSESYIEQVLKAVESNPDCVATNGTYWIDGRFVANWYLSKDFTDVNVSSVLYHRRTNHISPVLREHALKAGFPDKSNAEDKAYSEALNPFLKSETTITEPIYHYKYVTSNKEYK